MGDIWLHSFQVSASNLVAVTTGCQLWGLNCLRLNQPASHLPRDEERRHVLRPPCLNSQPVRVAISTASPSPIPAHPTINLPHARSVVYLEYARDPFRDLSHRCRTQPPLPQQGTQLRGSILRHEQRLLMLVVLLLAEQWVAAAGRLADVISAPASKASWPRVECVETLLSLSTRQWPESGNHSGTQPFSLPQQLRNQTSFSKRLGAQFAILRCRWPRQAACSQPLHRSTAEGLVFGARGSLVDQVQEERQVGIAGPESDRQSREGLPLDVADCCCTTILTAK